MLDRNNVCAGKSDSGWQTLSIGLSQCAFADKNSEVIHSFYWAPIVYCEFWYLYGIALKFFLSLGRTGGLSSQSTKETARRLVAPLYGIQIIQAIVSCLMVKKRHSGAVRQ